FSLSFLLYVGAIDLLHQAFVAGECRTRRPSAGDEVLLDGLVDAFRAAEHAAPADAGLPDVEGAFAHVVAQLREIADALDTMSGAPYRATIRRLVGTTPG